MPIKSYLALSVFFVAPLLQACGPWLPESYLLRNDEVFYAPPELGFAAELKHLLPEAVPHQAVLDQEPAGGPTAVQELRAALSAKGVEQGASERIVAEFGQFRRSLNDAKRYLDTQPYPGSQVLRDRAESDAKRSALENLKVPEGLPSEFRLYLAGALAYYQGELSEARAHWKALLQLPEEARHYRSVMAAFMMAKTCPDEDPAGYESVRSLAGDGFADSLGLAAASYGRQAQLYLSHGAFLPAMDLYLQQWASGYANAVQSLEITARRAWDQGNEESFLKLVENETARAVLTAYLLTRHDGELNRHRRQRFLEALPGIKGLEVAEAGRFALVEYQENNLSAARLWLNHAQADDALALWVRSKLLLREGRIDEGRTLMLALTNSFEAKPPDWRRLDTQRAWGELGLLYLREERFSEAADAFLNAGSWQDCAYVLERLLSTEDLLAWLKKHAERHPDAEGWYGMDARSLVARRLMREARFEQALELFNPQLRAHAEDYIQCMQAAFNSKDDASVRAQHFWGAARIMRDFGMPLFGSELAPDYTWLRGQFELEDIYEARKKVRWTSGYQINEVSYGEMDRGAKTRVQPEERFHYRYRAVHLAELAAGLLPNNDENAARIYLVAASWIKKRDPVVADRLYKQLAVRCAETELGQSALEMKWFPPVALKEHEPFVSK